MTCLMSKSARRCLLPVADTGKEMGLQPEGSPSDRRRQEPHHGQGLGMCWPFVELIVMKTIGFPCLLSSFAPSIQKMTLSSCGLFHQWLKAPLSPPARCLHTPTCSSRPAFSSRAQYPSAESPGSSLLVSWGPHSLLWGVHPDLTRKPDACGVPSEAPPCKFCRCFGQSQTLDRSPAAQF